MSASKNGGHPSLSQTHSSTSHTTTLHSTRKRRCLPHLPPRLSSLYTSPDPLHGTQPLRLPSGGDAWLRLPPMAARVLGSLQPGPAMRGGGRDGRPRSMPPMGRHPYMYKLLVLLLRIFPSRKVIIHICSPNSPHLQNSSRAVTNQ